MMDLHDNAPKKNTLIKNITAVSDRHGTPEGGIWLVAHEVQHGCVLRRHLLQCLGAPLPEPVDGAAVEQGRGRRATVVEIRGLRVHGSSRGPFPR